MVQIARELSLEIKPGKGASVVPVSACALATRGRQRAMEHGLFYPLPGNVYLMGQGPHSSSICTVG